MPFKVVGSAIPHVPRRPGECIAFEPKVVGMGGGSEMQYVGPNHSLKRSANGRPPGPGHRYGVHFLWPGPGVLPSAPA